MLKMIEFKNKAMPAYIKKSKNSNRYVILRHKWNYLHMILIVECAHDKDNIDKIR